MINPMPELRHAHADFALRHPYVGKRHSKLSPGRARERKGAAWSGLDEGWKRFGKMGHDHYRISMTFWISPGLRFVILASPNKVRIAPSRILG